MARLQMRGRADVRRTAKVPRFSSTTCLPSSLASTIDDAACGYSLIEIGYECRIEVAVPKNFAILILLLVVGTEAFGQNQSPPSDTPKYFCAATLDDILKE